MAETSEAAGSEEGTGVLGARRVPFESIPVIDIAPMFGGHARARRETAAALRAACHDVGFFYIRNHRVPTALIDRAFGECARFFALPFEEKMALDIHTIGRHRGFVPPGGLAADPSAKPDLQEGYELALELPDDDPDYLAGSVIYGPNVWPENLPGFRDGVYAYFEEILSLGRVLFGAFALALDLPPDYFDSVITKPMGQLRLIYYPPQEAPIHADEIGIGAHTDYECFTILKTGGPGLQVRNTDGEWIEAPPIPDTFVINIGDMMQRWTNDLFQSTPHRVINTSGRTRYSLPFFFGANADTIVAPLDCCTGPDNPPRYPPTQSGYWTDMMYAEAYTYRRPFLDQLPKPELTP